MDRLESMSIVLAVAEAGSLAAAVRRLNTPPATASRKITELEEHLGTKLFDRSARRLVLPDAGASYVAGLKRILADISEIERAASGEYTAPTGELVVTAPVGLGRIHLMPILAEFLSAYPDITVRLVLPGRVGLSDFTDMGDHSVSQSSSRRHRQRSPRQSRPRPRRRSQRGVRCRNTCP